MTITLNPTRDGTPRRIPKLAVRNRTSEHAAAHEHLRNPDHQHHDPRSVAEQQSPCDPLLHPAFRREPGPTPSTRSADAEAASGKVPTKRKSKRLLGFLTLKEPSTSAFEEFAEQEKKKLASQKGGSNVLRGVSSQKLPQHVPKVNSKWDGLPESTKRSTAEKDSSAARHSAMSFVSSRSGTSDRDSVLSNGPALPSWSSRIRGSNERSTQLSAAAVQSIAAGQRPSAHASQESGSLYSFSSHPKTPPELEPSPTYSSSVCTPTTPDSMPRTPKLESSVAIRGNSTTRVHVAAITPHSSVASKDVAPWEAFEPRSDSAQHSPRGTTCHHLSAGHRFSQRFGAKLGLK